MKHSLKIVVVALLIIVFSGVVFTSCNLRDKPEPGIYTLQEAYDKGIINMRELKSIAYHHSPNRDDLGAFVPMIKKKVHITQEEVNAIAREYYQTSNKIDYEYECLGVYNNAIAIRIKPFADFMGSATREIEGITFTFSTWRGCILLWVKE